MARAMKAGLLVSVLVLMGQEDCEPERTPDLYCDGAESPDPDFVPNPVYPITPVLPLPPYPGIQDAGIAGATEALVDGQQARYSYSTVKIAGCGGVMIGPHTILTAAHCLRSDRVQRVEVPGHPDCFTVVAERKHPDYWRFDAAGDLEARKSDIGLVFTEQELPGPFVSPENGFYIGRPMAAQCKAIFMQGWGNTMDPATQGQLRQAKFGVLLEEEKILWADTYTLGGGCHGDSGSPLYAVLETGTVLLAGIFSTLNQVDCQGHNKFVRVDYPTHWQWIKDNVR